MRLIFCGETYKRSNEAMPRRNGLQILPRAISMHFDVYEALAFEKTRVLPVRFMTVMAPLVAPLSATRHPKQLLGAAVLIDLSHSRSERSGASQSASLLQAAGYDATLLIYEHVLQSDRTGLVSTLAFVKILEVMASDGHLDQPHFCDIPEDPFSSLTLNTFIHLTGVTSISLVDRLVPGFSQQPKPNGLMRMELVEELLENHNINLPQFTPVIFHPEGKAYTPLELDCYLASGPEVGFHFLYMASPDSGDVGLDEYDFNLPAQQETGYFEVAKQPHIYLIGLRVWSAQAAATVANSSVRAWRGRTATRFKAPHAVRDAPPTPETPWPPASSPVLEELSPSTCFRNLSTADMEEADDDIEDLGDVEAMAAMQQAERGNVE
jgi:hypothetical protein